MTIVGHIAEIWRFPVKSMAGERVAEAELTSGGIPGDRAYALIDADSGKVVSAKSVRLFPDILDYRAALAGPAVTGAPPPPVAITCPDGTTIRSDDPGADAELSARLGRQVGLAASAPPDFTIDQYQADLDADTPGRHVEQPLGAALFAQLGAESAVPPGSFFDLFPMTLITTATLRRLAELAPGTDFDLRRFRMNLVVESDAPGFAENDWIGGRVGVGDGALAVAIGALRCIMTTLAQPGLPRDIGVLRALAEHNSLPVVLAGHDLGPRPCAGIYAEVARPGILRRGDPVTFG